MTDADAMDRALALARRGWGRVAPNPLVGAVLVREGTVVGEGYHAEFGGPHAERAAIDAAGEVEGTTLAVTLEPCNHSGKTAPCVDLILERGIRRVVYAMADPHPDAGGGAARLRRSGIDVEAGVRERDAAALNAAFLFNQVRADRPFIALKLATSVDGYIADLRGTSQWISGTVARDYVHWLRAGFDAIGVGAETVRRDDPRLTVRGEVTPRVPPTRVVWWGAGPPPSPDRVVFEAAGGPSVVIAPPARAKAVATRLGPAGVEVLPAPDLAAGLAGLRGRGVTSLLVEGGGRLAGALRGADLVDRYYWIQAPRWLGGGTKAFTEESPRPLAESSPWHVVERRALGEDSLLVLDRSLCLQAS